MKIFISQPMRDKTDEEILEERNHIVNFIKVFYGLDSVDVIDSFFKDFDPNAMPTDFLGESIKLLGRADLVVFAEGWENYRGCMVEHYVCNRYNIPIFEI